MMMAVPFVRGRIVFVSIASSSDLTNIILYLSVLLSAV